MYESLADTLLYEEARKIIKEVEKEKHRPDSKCHKINSAIYQEFWRRGKAKYYFEAHDRTMKEIGKNVESRVNL